MSNDNNHEEGRIDEISGVKTTGHEWDGIEELNNPAPRWWVIIFILCTLFAIGYWIFYPSWPIPGGHMKGVGNWSQYSKLADEQQEIIDTRQKYQVKFKDASLEDIISDEELYSFAVAGGESSFGDNCAGCHGQGAAGFKGYPNLNDDDWLWGGNINDIYYTIKYGIRNQHEKSRMNQMPAFGKDGILQHSEILDLTNYAQNLSQPGTQEDPEFAASHKIFMDNCASCHGNQGEGNQELGAPALNDQIWLYGGDSKDIIETITHSRAGAMPNWDERLDDSTIKQLAIYVYSLGGATISSESMDQ